MNVIFKIVFIQPYASVVLFFYIYNFYKWYFFPFCNSSLPPLEGRRPQCYFNFLSVFSAFIRSINYSWLRPRRPWLYSSDAINLACFCFLYSECDTLLLTTLGNVWAAFSDVYVSSRFLYDTKNFQDTQETPWLKSQKVAVQTQVATLSKVIHLSLCPPPPPS